VSANAIPMEGDAITLDTSIIRKLTSLSTRRKVNRFNISVCRQRNFQLQRRPTIYSYLFVICFTRVYHRWC